MDTHHLPEARKMMVRLSEYTIYLRNGHIFTIWATGYKCVDQRNRVYRFYDKVDESALNEVCVAEINNPDAIIKTIEKTNIEEQ